jgi:SAM-dependent methyltransferase
VTVNPYEISEAGHRILNPLSARKLDLLGQICVDRPLRHLDLACGKGEMVCQWALHHHTRGVGVDVSPAFLAAARARATELGVASRVEFHQADAAHYDAGAEPFDLVSCLGATWIGGGLVGTLALMRRRVSSGGLLLVGEPFWKTEPEDGHEDLLGQQGDFASLSDTVGRCESVGCELVEMVMSDEEDWDRYQASQWMAVDRWWRDHPEDPEARQLREIQSQWRRAYLAYGRQRWGWGVFVLRPSG